MDREIIIADYLKTNQAARHIDACNQVGQHLWRLGYRRMVHASDASACCFPQEALNASRWQQLEVEAPERFRRLRPSLPTLRFDASWEGKTWQSRGPDGPEQEDREKNGNEGPLDGAGVDSALASGPPAEALQSLQANEI